MEKPSSEKDPSIPLPQGPVEMSRATVFLERQARCPNSQGLEASTHVTAVTGVLVAQVSCGP